MFESLSQALLSMNSSHQVGWESYCRGCCVQKVVVTIAGFAVSSSDSISCVPLQTTRSIYPIVTASFKSTSIWLNNACITCLQITVIWEAKTAPLYSLKLHKWLFNQWSTAECTQNLYCRQTQRQKICVDSVSLAGRRCWGHGFDDGKICRSNKNNHALEFF